MVQKCTAPLLDSIHAYYNCMTAWSHVAVFTTDAIKALPLGIDICMSGCGTSTHEVCKWQDVCVCVRVQVV